MACAPHDLLDRRACLRQLHHRGVDVLTAEIAFVLELFGCGEKRRIDGRGAQRLADLAHAAAGRRKKGLAGVLHQVPPVGDLHGVGKRPRRRQRVSASSVACDHLDLRLGGEPGLGCGRLPVRQQANGAAALQIADERAVAMISLPRPVVDPYRPWRFEGRGSAPPDQSQ